MATTSKLNLDIPDIGADADTWGDILNADLEIIDKAVQYERLVKLVAGGSNVTLTAEEASYTVLRFTGVLLANISVSIPDNPERAYIVENATTGAFTLTFKTVSGTGLVLPQDSLGRVVYNDGTNVTKARPTGQQVFPPEVNIASASTLDLTSGDTNQYFVTGTTTINAVTMEMGAVIKARFESALTLTHGANLVLPALANYTTAAGDIATFTKGADGSVRVEIARIGGLPVTPPIIASQAEAEAGTDNTKYMSPLRVLNSIDKQFQSRSLTTNGYQIFPSGLIIQWGKTGTIPADTSVNVVFPINFPNACFSVVTNNQNAPASGTVLVSGARLFDKPNFLISNDSFAAVLNWIAIGY